MAVDEPQVLEDLEARRLRARRPGVEPRMPDAIRRARSVGAPAIPHQRIRQEAQRVVVAREALERDRAGGGGRRELGIAGRRALMQRVAQAFVVPPFRLEVDEGAVPGQVPVISTLY